MGYYFGDFARYLVGLCAGLCCIGLVDAQIGAIGFIFDHFFELPHETGVILAFSILIIYSSFGGIKSVIAIPMMCGFAITKAGGLNAIISIVPGERFSFFSNKELVYRFLPVYLTFLIPNFVPSLIQRMMITKNKDQIVRSFFISGTLLLPVGILVLLISLSVLTLYAELDANLVFPAVIDNLLPTGLKGIAVAGLLAIIMSTADSILNAGSISFVHDFLKPMICRRNQEMDELRVTRWVTPSIGFLALFVAMNFKSIFDIVRISYIFWQAAVMPPFLLVIFGYRPSSRALTLASAISIPLVFITTLFEKQIGFSSVVLCMLLDFAILLCYDRLNLIRQAKKRRITSALGSSLKSLILEQRKQIQNSLSSRDYSFIFISNGLCFVYVATFYFFITTLVDVNLRLYEYVFVLSGLFAMLIIFAGEFLAMRLKKKLPALWALAVGYSCVFLGTCFLIKVGVENYAVINFLISIFMLLMLLDWRSSLILSVIGIFAAIIVQGFVFPEAIAYGNIQWILALGALIVEIISILIVRGKEFLEQEKERSLRAFTGVLAHELRTPL